MCSWLGLLGDVLKYMSLLYVYYIDSMVHAAVGCVYISQVHWVNRTFICNTKGPSLAQAMGWLVFFLAFQFVPLYNMQMQF